MIRNLVFRLIVLNNKIHMRLLILCLIVVCHSINWDKVQDVVKIHLNKGAFPGCVLMVANKTHILYKNSFGYYSHQTAPYSSPPFTDGTFFDIASLTKVTATLQIIMHLYENGVIALEDKVSKYIPQFAQNNKSSITIQNLLLHNSGLQSDPPIFGTKQQIMAWIYSSKLQYSPGSKFLYSDDSFILLGEIVERVLGGPLNDIARIYFDQLGMLNTTYLPNPKFDYYKFVFAPTEYSGERKKTIRGEVHDPRAYIFGGTAGHAGVFSTGFDLVKYMQMHLNDGLLGDGTRIFSSKTVQKFYSRVDGLPYQNRRALGWDTVPIQTYPPCGNLFSLNSFGHTGYTGTMMFADRDKQLIIVFLTNRVHPTSANSQGIQIARMEISDTIVKTLFSK